jgi:hypothetical protein
MPGDASQQAQPAAAAPNALLRQPMPTFDGTGTVNKWIRSFERWAATAGLAEDTFKNVLENAFTGDAARWYAVRDSEDPDRSWDETKNLLKGRFSAPMTAAETNRMLISLKQGQGESPKVFADKVEAALRACREEITLPAANTAQGRENISRTADAIFEFFGRMIFVQGLQESIKKEVCNRGVSSWKDCIQAATDAQTYKPTQATGGRSINAMEDNEQEEEEPWQKAILQQLEALNARGARGGGRGGRRGGRGFRGGRGGGRQENGRPSWIRDAMLPPGTCFRCGNQGHIRMDCICKPENFKWDDLAKQLAAQRQETASMQQPNQQPEQLALPPPEGLSSLAGGAGAAAGSFRFPDF